jgi:hypothetical protein
MTYKAVVCNVDGTITNSSKMIQTLGIEVLRQAQDKGCTVILASGNVLPVVYGLSTFIGLRGPVVAENGGVVSYKDEVYMLFSNEVPLKAYEHLRTVIPGIRRLYTTLSTPMSAQREADLATVLKALEGWPLKWRPPASPYTHAERAQQDGRVEKPSSSSGWTLRTCSPSGRGQRRPDAEGMRQCLRVGNASEKAKVRRGLVTKGARRGVREGLLSLADLR